MFTAMDSFRDGGRSYQRAIRIKPFATLDKAKTYAEKRAKGKPFVCVGQKVVWVG